MKYDVSKSTYIKKYTEQMTEIMKSLSPDWDSSEVTKIINDMVKTSVQNPVVEMDNNFTGEHKEATLISVLDWSFTAKPILAGNGTFYKNQYQALNPVGQMLMNMLAERKAYKKQMFKIEDTESDEYKDLDRLQQNTKVNCNS